MNRLATRLTIALATCYAAACLSLTCQACYAYERGDTSGVLVLGGCAVLSALAIGHHVYHHDELHAARARLERAARPPDAVSERALRDDIALGWNDLTSACCLTAWASHGTDHDPATCTRKDQTT